MLTSLSQAVPFDAPKLLLVLFLSFLIGLEREEHRSARTVRLRRVRTFPLIG